MCPVRASCGKTGGKWVLRASHRHPTPNEPGRKRSEELPPQPASPRKRCNTDRATGSQVAGRRVRSFGAGFCVRGNGPWLSSWRRTGFRTSCRTKHNRRRPGRVGRLPAPRPRLQVGEYVSFSVTFRLREKAPEKSSQCNYRLHCRRLVSVTRTVRSVGGSPETKTG